MSENLDKWKCLYCGEEQEIERGIRPLVCPNPNCMKKGNFEALGGPWSYFTPGRTSKFIPKKLADEISQNHHFATHRKSWVVWCYDGGCYLPDGDAAVRESCREKLGELAKDNYVNEVLSHIRDTTFRDPKDFNPPLNLLNVKNGILDITTRTLTPHTPDIIFTGGIPVDYNPDAKCPKIGEFLNEVLPPDAILSFVQAVGFCLYREYFIRKVIIFLGEGGNGKSTVLNLIGRLLGEENVAHLPVQELSDKFAVGGLYGKMANICADLDTYAWKSTGKFKMLTGRDYIEADVKHKKRFKFVNHSKFFFSANRLPETNDDTRAFYDRLYTINCLMRFTDNPDPHAENEKKKDPRIIDKIATPDELSGLLNAALDGLGCLTGMGYFIDQTTQDEIRRTWKRRSNPIASFADDYLEVKVDGEALSDDVYGSFCAYCRAHGFPIKDKNVFGRELPKWVKGNITIKQTTTPGGRARAWHGVVLRTEAKEEPIKKQSTITRDTRDKIYYLISKIKNYGIIKNDGILPVHPVPELEVLGNLFELEKAPVQPRVEKLAEREKAELSAQDIEKAICAYPSKTTLPKAKLAEDLGVSLDRLNPVIEELEQKRGKVIDRGSMVEVL